MSHHQHNYGWARDNQIGQYPGASSTNAGQPGPRLPPLEGLLAGAPSGHEVAEAQQSSQSYTRPPIPPLGSHAPSYHQQPHAPYPPSAATYHGSQAPPRQHHETHAQYPPHATGSRDIPGRFPDPELPHSAQAHAWNQPPLPPSYPRSRPLSHEPSYDANQTSIFREPESRHWEHIETAPLSQPPPVPLPSANTPILSEIPNLLAADRAHALRGLRFNISMRQQPKAARACGSGERDRRNIDPPPIIQLQVEAPEMTKEELNKYLRYESYVMTCGITDETGTQDASQMPAEYRHQRRLTGSLVGTPFVGRDEHEEEGCFFPFSDLSVRTLGTYRLKFNMIMIDPARGGQCKHFPILAEILSAPFDVYTAKEFPGINESTKLVRTLREQGCIIAIKKGNDKKRRLDEDDGSDKEEEGNEDKRINTRG